VAHNVPIFVIESRYDKLRLFLALHYLILAILALSVITLRTNNQIRAKVPEKRAIMIQYVLLYGISEIKATFDTA